MHIMPRRPTGTTTFQYDGKIHRAHYWTDLCPGDEQTEETLRTAITVVYRRREKTSPWIDGVPPERVAARLLGELIKAPGRASD